MAPTVYGDALELTAQIITNSRFDREQSAQGRPVSGGIVKTLKKLVNNKPVSDNAVSQKSWEDIYDEVISEIDLVRENKLEDTNFTDRELLQVRAGLMREHTAEDLKSQLNSEFDVVNAPLVVGKNVMHVLDHLVASDKGLVTVTNMHLVEPLTWEISDSYAYVPRNCPHWAVVSDLVASANALPVAPRQIIVGVSGPGLDSIDGKMFVANRYIDVASDSLKPTPCLVIFVPHANLSEIINMALVTPNDNDPKVRPVTGAELVSADTTIVLNSLRD